MAPKLLLEGRRALLVQYLREVAAELVSRGILDAQLGKDPIEILKKRPSEMLGLMIHDLKDAGFNVGKELMSSAFNGLIGSLFVSRRP